MSEMANRPEGTGYETPVVFGGVLATVFFPVIALIAALILHGGEPDPVKRGQLRTWAWVSGGWLVLQVIIFVIVFLAIASTVMHPMP